jgi:hypothetical protein
MKEFLDIINGIGFVKKTLNDFTFYQYGEWTIFLNKIFDNQSFNLIYSPPLIHKTIENEQVSVSHNNISINDYTILKKYFKSEWRELKFKELGL